MLERVLPPNRAAGPFGACLAALFVTAPIRAQMDPGPKLRFSGDVRAATSVEGAVLGGPALRFRYGIALGRKPKDGSPSDLLIGSWGGVELSSGLLFGKLEPGSYGAIATFGVREWLTRWQSDTFLQNERFSVLGALLPEVGLVLGVRDAPRAYLGWDLPLGAETFQIVPGVLWISPGQRVPVLFTLALRVPM